jgi:hypothetical protein
MVVEIFETESCEAANRNAFLGAPISKPKVAKAIPCFLPPFNLPRTHHAIARTASLRTAVDRTLTATDFKRQPDIAFTHAAHMWQAMTRQLRAARHRRFIGLLYLWKIPPRPA